MPRENKEKLLKKLCVSIKARNLKAIKEKLKNVNFAEIRLDLIDDFHPGKDEDEFKNILNEFKNLIITIRKGNFPLEERKKIVKICFDLSVKYIDIEYNDRRLIKYFFKLKNKEFIFRNKFPLLIISYHNYETMPSKYKTEEIIGKLFENGADIAKFVAKVDKDSSNIMKQLLKSIFYQELLSKSSFLLKKGFNIDIYDNKIDLAVKKSKKIQKFSKRIIAFGMGYKSLCLRVLNLLFGAPFTYVSYSKGEETADGQVTIGEFINKFQNNIEDCLSLID